MEEGRLNRRISHGWQQLSARPDRAVANKVISTIRIADLLASLSTKVRGSIRKWRPDQRKDGYEKDKKRKSDGRTTAEKNVGAGPAEDAARQRRMATKRHIPDG
jgi:hypothetical protein